MKKLILIFLVFVSLMGSSQITIVNNTNLYGFTFTNLGGIMTRTNSANEVYLSTYLLGNGKLDTILNLTCYDSLKISFTFWRTHPLGMGWGTVNSITATPFPTSYTITSLNTNSLSFNFAATSPYDGCGHMTRLHIKDLKIIGYQNTINCTTTAVQPLVVYGPTLVCSGSTNVYSITPICGAFSYSWALPGGWSGTSTTNIITTTVGLAGGNLSVTATNSCGTSPAQTLSVNVYNGLPPATPGAINGLNPICAGYSSNYSIALVGGATSYSWSLPLGWSGASYTNNINVIPSLNSGTISVWALNACGISSPQTLSVNISTFPTITISGNNSVCIGNGLNLIAGGANTYTWSNGPVTPGTIVSPTINTTYSVTGTSISGCTNMAVQSITVNPLPTITAISSSSMICIGETATITASGASTYSWSIGPITNSIIVSPNSTSLFTVTGTDTNGCSNSTLIALIVDLCTDIKESKAEISKFEVSPNPFNEFITVMSGACVSTSHINIYNTDGALIYSTEIESKNKEINLSNLRSGLYFIRINDQTGSSIKKIIKE